MKTYQTIQLEIILFPEQDAIKVSLQNDDGTPDIFD